MRKLWLFFLVLLGFHNVSFAAESTAGSNDRGRIVLYSENDTYSGTDQHYTNGLQVRYISPALFLNKETNKQEGDQNKASFLEGFMKNIFQTMHGESERSFSQYHYSMGFGQKMFTPEDTESHELQKNDRPYAAYLYGFIGFHAKQATLMDTLELNFGIIGPAAMGRQIQNGWHRIIGVDRVNGWDHQLRNEPGLMLSWSRTYRINAEAKQTGWEWDVLPYHTVTLGNVLTQAIVGSEVRWGWNMPREFGVSSIGPGGNISAPFADPSLQRRNQDFGWYVFAGIEGRAVARNIFLDGNTWKDSHSVSKEPWVGQLNAGITFLFREIKLTYNHVYVSKEFKNQGSGHHYASITLSFPF